MSKSVALTNRFILLERADVLEDNFFNDEVNHFSYPKALKIEPSQLVKTEKKKKPQKNKVSKTLQKAEPVAVSQSVFSKKVKKRKEELSKNKLGLVDMLADTGANLSSVRSASSSFPAQFSIGTMGGSIMIDRGTKYGFSRFSLLASVNPHGSDICAVCDLIDMDLYFLWSKDGPVLFHPSGRVWSLTLKEKLPYLTVDIQLEICAFLDVLAENSFYAAESVLSLEQRPAVTKTKGSTRTLGSKDALKGRRDPKAEKEKRDLSSPNIDWGKIGQADLSDVSDVDLTEDDLKRLGSRRERQGRRNGDREARHSIFMKISKDFSKIWNLDSFDLYTETLQGSAHGTVAVERSVGLVKLDFKRECDAKSTLKNVLYSIDKKKMACALEIYSDGGQEFRGEFADWFDDHENENRPKHIPTIPDNHNSNARAEAAINALREESRYYLSRSGLPEQFLEFAMVCSAQNKNRAKVEAAGASRSDLEVLYGKQKFLFGDIVTYKVGEKKVLFTGNEGIFLCYSHLNSAILLDMNILRRDHKIRIVRVGSHRGLDVANQTRRSEIQSIFKKYLKIDKKKEKDDIVAQGVGFADDDDELIRDHLYPGTVSFPETPGAVAGVHTPGAPVAGISEFEPGVSPVPLDLDSEVGPGLFAPDHFAIHDSSDEEEIYVDQEIADINVDFEEIGDFEVAIAAEDAGDVAGEVEGAPVEVPGGAAVPAVDRGFAPNYGPARVPPLPRQNVQSSELLDWLNPVASRLQGLIDALYLVDYSKPMQDDVLHEPDVIAFVNENMKEIQKVLLATKRGCDNVWKAFERNFEEILIFQRFVDNRDEDIIFDRLYDEFLALPVRARPVHQASMQLPPWSSGHVQAKFFFADKTELVLRQKQATGFIRLPRYLRWKDLDRIEHTDVQKGCVLWDERIELVRMPVWNSQGYESDLAYVCPGMVSQYGHTTLSRKDPEFWDEPQMSARRSEWEKLHSYGTFGDEVYDEWDLKKNGKLVLRSVWVDTIKDQNTPREKRKSRCAVDGSGLKSGNTTKVCPLEHDVRRAMFFKSMLVGNQIGVSDAESAYLNASLHEDSEVYMLLPDWLGYPPGACARIKKALYGLPQSGPLFQDHAAAILIRLGFVESSEFRGLFERYGRNGTWEAVGAYVDDFVISSPDVQSVIDEITREGGLTFGKVEIINSEQDVHFNGVSFKFIVRDHQMYLVEHMTEYWTRVLAKSKEMLGIGNNGVYKYRQAPNASAIPEDFFEQPSELFEETKRLGYKKVREDGTLAYDPHSLCAMILYGARCNRPDLANVASVLQRCISCWSKGADILLRHALEYIESTATDGMWFKWISVAGTQAAGRNRIVCMTDADLGGSLKHMTAKSTSGYVTFYYNDVLNLRWCIDWSTKLQQHTATSTPWSELSALQRGLQRSALSHAHLLETLTGYTVPVNVFSDNASMIQIIEQGYSPALRFLSRMSRLNVPFLHEIFSAEYNSLHFICSEENTADLFTKGLGTSLHCKHKEGCFLWPTGA